MKTAVEAIFVGKARRYNRRFLQMCSHHLVEPVACTPASGWEKGQVENQVGNLRDQMFRPKPRVKSLAELNAWLEDQCIAYAKRTKHPEFKDRTVWDVFQVIEGYQAALRQDADAIDDAPKSIQIIMKRSVARSWKHLANERLDNVKPTIPLGGKVLGPIEI